MSSLRANGFNLLFLIRTRCTRIRSYAFLNIISENMAVVISTYMGIRVFGAFSYFSTVILPLSFLLEGAFYGNKTI